MAVRSDGTLTSRLDQILGSLSQYVHILYFFDDMSCQGRVEPELKLGLPHLARHKHAPGIVLGGAAEERTLNHAAPPMT